MPKARRYVLGQTYQFDNGAFIWSLGKKPYACTKCIFRSSRKHSALRHHYNIHSDIKNSFTCDVCTRSFTRRDQLLRHKRIHKTDRPYGCPHCIQAFRRSDHLKRHIFEAHLSQKKPFKCNHCPLSFRRKESLLRHEETVHDIGDLVCPICEHECFRLRMCTTCQNKETMACRRCFRLITGKNVRIEHEWSDYLDLHFYPEWRICRDSRVMGDACHMYRPDGLWASDSFVLHWELDEYQHQKNGGNYDCDERRISEIYEEFPGKQYVVIRVNPHNYKAPHGTVKPKQEDRKYLMLRVMKACLRKRWDTLVHIVYMFYSADNTKITKNIAKTLLFSEKDVDDFCAED